MNEDGVIPVMEAISDLKIVKLNLRYNLISERAAKVICT